MNENKKAMDTQTLRYTAPKKVKFSSFTESELEYQMEPDRLQGINTENLIKFIPKKEVTEIPFNPEVRHRLPEMPIHLQ